ncbi:hypothetical protein TNCV_317661 [Trichonephila clavipes]|nr:hypothetical protein TNCV_317661 [Trichonephila clavipes]
MLPKELHQLKYEALSVPQGSVLLVKKDTRKKKFNLIFVDQLCHEFEPSTTKDPASGQCRTTCGTCYYFLQLVKHFLDQPDLSPIEHIWDMMGRRLHLPGNDDDLVQQSDKFGENTAGDHQGALCMPRHVEAGIRLEYGAVDNNFDLDFS